MATLTGQTEAEPVDTRMAGHLRQRHEESVEQLKFHQAEVDRHTRITAACAAGLGELEPSNAEVAEPVPSPAY